MSLGTTLPPQAYTREMLAQAFVWLQSQPESIKHLAQSPDALVGLFLRAKRNGESSLESVAPKSTETFRHRLRDIASELQKFGPKVDSNAFDLSSVKPPASSSAHGTALNETAAESSFDEDLERLPDSSLFYQSVAARPSPPPNKETGIALDPRSTEMIRLVTQQLNLSKDSEALRILVALGFERVKSLFPAPHSH
jgi:hypothetical protein